VLINSIYLLVICIIYMIFLDDLLLLFGVSSDSRPYALLYLYWEMPALFVLVLWQAVKYHIMAAGEFGWVTRVQNATALGYVGLVYLGFEVCGLGIRAISLAYGVVEAVNLALGIRFLLVNYLFWEIFWFFSFLVMLIIIYKQFF
jgi:hypothetical protein